MEQLEVWWRPWVAEALSVAFWCHHCNGQASKGWSRLWEQSCLTAHVFTLRGGRDLTNWTFGFPQAWPPAWGARGWWGPCAYIWDSFWGHTIVSYKAKQRHRNPKGRSLFGAFPEIRILTSYNELGLDLFTILQILLETGFTALGQTSCQPRKRTSCDSLCVIRILILPWKGPRCCPEEMTQLLPRGVL